MIVRVLLGLISRVHSLDFDAYLITLAVLAMANRRDNLLVKGNHDKFWARTEPFADYRQWREIASYGFSQYFCA